MTANPLVEFLAKYGPTNASNNLYDEHVVTASQNFGCEAINIEQDLIDELVGDLKSLRSVILTGTAGDGKTYTARKLFEKVSVNDNEIWQSYEKSQSCEYGNNRVVFIKDLSELGKKEKKLLYQKVCTSLENVSKDIFVICVNDGQLLKFFRDRTDTSSGDRLYKTVRKMIERNYETDKSLKLHLINMSRRTSNNLLEKVIDAVAKHPDWENCKGCKALNDKKFPCPIQVNRKLLSQVGESSIRARLRDMIQMAAADGQHLSIRHLILLSVNIMLGCQNTSSGRRLMTCNMARRRAKELNYKSTNPYANIFGDNLQKYRRKKYEIFSTLGEFRVGHETNKFFDQSIMQNSDNIPNHPIYGDIILNSNEIKCYEGDEASLKDNFRAIVDQRRRLFFSMDIDMESPPSHISKDPWNLTAYRYGGAYCFLTKAASSESQRMASLRTDICKSIIIGLNRMMTGSMVFRNDCLWIVEPSGNYRSSENTSLLAAVAKKTNDSMVRFEFEISKEDNIIIPRLKVYMGQDTLPVNLDLRPTLTECLLRVANGALPYSFPFKIRKEIHMFQFRLITKLKRVTNNSYLLSELNVKRGNVEVKPISVLLEQENWL